MYKYSKNAKLERTLKAIEEQLQGFGLEEVKHYYNEFNKYGIYNKLDYIDYNIVQYGNLLIYYDQIRDFYKEMGYKTQFSDEKLWETYKRQVGYVVRRLIEEE